MYNIRPTTKFQKDLKRVKKRGFDISLPVSYTHLDVYKRQLRGITEEGKILVNDPNDNASKNFVNRQFDLNLIMRESKNFWCFY